MKPRLRSISERFVGIPLAALYTFAAWPLAFLAVRFVAVPSIEVSSLTRSLAFALAGAAISAIIGGALGAVVGTSEVPGRKWSVALSVGLIAAPPAFWWIGLTRLPGRVRIVERLASGSGVVGVALAPITLLLVLAATREIPATAYEAARVSLGPTRRVVFVLLPLLRPAAVAGFLLTAILLLGESEIPFLFGFRTSMTDVVTTFSQTFDPGRTVPIILPLVGTVLLLGLLMARPLFAVVLSMPGGGRGIVRKRGSAFVALGRRCCRHSSGCH